MSRGRGRSGDRHAARLLRLARRTTRLVVSARRRVAEYAVAILGPVTLTLLVRNFPDVWPRPYSWQFLGISIAVALFGGMFPGLVALGVSTMVMTWLRIPTPAHPGVEMFAAVGLALLGIVARLRQAEQDLRDRVAILHSIIESMPDAVYVGTRAGITLCNERALRMLGARSADDLESRTGELLESFALRRPDTGAWLQQDEMPFWRALRGETVVQEVVARNAETGSDIYIRSACAPIERDGHPVAAVAVLSDVTERKRAEQALEMARRAAEQAQAAAEQANQAKDHFLAVLSHELRTPLTPVLAGAALLKRDATLSAQARHYVEVLQRNVELESRLIDDLLDVTRIAHGKVVLARRPVEIRGIVEHAIEVCRPDLDARHLQLVTALDAAAGLLVAADEARLQQVFWNLLKNAIKFTPKGGRVAVGCAVAAHGVVAIDVSDNGIGIAPEDLPGIFNAFAQAERTLNRQFGGLGLGLTITRALVEQHGGTVTAESGGAGKGATFTVRLPVLASTPWILPAPTSGQRRRARVEGRLRVLLVEDHADTAQMMSAMLERGGHEVATSVDVASALATAGTAPFDLLVSDVGLPDRSGIDLVRELRLRGQQMPAIAISGYGQEEDVRRSLEAGFSAHLVKPVDLGRLLQTIDTAMLAARS